MYDVFLASRLAMQNYPRMNVSYHSDSPFALPPMYTVLWLKDIWMVQTIMSRSPAQQLIRYIKYDIP